MDQKKEAIEVGREIGNILEAWRPAKGNGMDVAEAVMHGLESYNINVAPTEESYLRAIFVYLKTMIAERRRSF